VREELPRLHDALENLVRTGRAGDALRFASLLAPFWESLGRIDEGRRRLESALSMPSCEHHPEALAGALAWAGTLAFRQRDQSGAHELTRRAVEVARSAGDSPGEAHALVSLARVHLRDEDHTDVQRYAGRGLELFERLGDRRGQAGALHMMAYSLDMQGCFD
jgi:hypothetical protein